MTAEQVQEHFKDTPLVFVEYYKYWFWFKGDKDGLVISACFGGNRDDIYKELISPTRWLHEVDQWYSVTVTRGEEEVFKYCDAW